MFLIYICISKKTMQRHNVIAWYEFTETLNCLWLNAQCAIRQFSPWITVWPFYAYFFSSKQKYSLASIVSSFPTKHEVFKSFVGESLSSKSSSPSCVNSLLIHLVFLFTESVTPLYKRLRYLKYSFILFRFRVNVSHFHY